MSEYAVDESTIFETPLVKLDLDIESDADVYAKAEWFNLYDAPHGGVDQIADREGNDRRCRGTRRPRSRRHRDRADLRQHRQRDRAPRRVRGYDVEIVMPDNAAGGKVDAVRDAGAEIHFVDANLGYDAVIERCEEIIAEDPEAYFRPNQYENPDNPVPTSARPLERFTGRRTAR